MTAKVVFRLQRFWPISGVMVDLYEAIKSGKKTSEWRDWTPYWRKRLCPTFNINPAICRDNRIEYVVVAKALVKPSVAWFTVGYPKANLPRLETDVDLLLVHFGKESNQPEQFEIKFENVKEVTN